MEAESRRALQLFRLQSLEPEGTSWGCSRMGRSQTLGRTSGGPKALVKKRPVLRNGSDQVVRGILTKPALGWQVTPKMATRVHGK